MKLRFLYLIIVAALSVILFSTCCNEEIEIPDDTPLPTLRIVQLCDPHLGFGSIHNDAANLEKVVAQINDLKPDLVLIAGDMVHEPNSELAISTFKNVIARIQSPVLLAPGNHDLCDEPFNYFSMEGLERFRKNFGADYSKVESKGRCIISANSHLWWTEAPQELVTAQDNWLKYTLQKAKSKAQAVILLTHVPLFISSVDEEDSRSNIPKTKREELLNLCEDYGVIVWLAGHAHRTLRNDYQGIAFLNGETISFNVDGEQYGFRLLTLFSDNSFEWELIPFPYLLPPLTKINS